MTTDKRHRSPQQFSSPFSIPNVRWFIWFRVCFNSRFYYPIFTILFLDFGLSLEDFAILNAIWAATIVLLEVPSGALADILGRRRLLIWSGTLMVAEMALLCVVPMGNHTLLFAVFALNRILSGAAEAAASGADEAIAFDSLKKHGNPDDWGRVLERQMRIKSITYIGAMSLGAVVYDPVYMNKLAQILGWDITFRQDLTIRFPLILTLVMATITLMTTLKMEEVSLNPCTDVHECRVSAMDAFRLTFQAGKWIWRTPVAFLIILAGLVFDNVIRMVITLSSQYYRLIQLPEASYGLIGSALAVLGLFIPKICLTLSNSFPKPINYAILSVFTLSGLVGMTFFIPIIGLIPVMILYASGTMTTFFTSRYLNQETDSSQRATVLSFKGLCFNLSYGFIGILYSILIAMIKNRIHIDQPGLSADIITDRAFMSAMDWFPYYFIALLGILILTAKKRTPSPRGKIDAL